MEYILAGLWKEQMSNNKLLRSLPGQQYTLVVFHRSAQKNMQLKDHPVLVITWVHRVTLISYTGVLLSCCQNLFESQGDMWENTLFVEGSYTQVCFLAKPNLIRYKVSCHSSGIQVLHFLCFTNFLFQFCTELGPVLHQCHIIASQMVHFVQQVQYYINFEVSIGPQELFPSLLK